MKTLEKFIDALYEAGWRAPLDAQHSRIKGVFQELQKENKALIQFAESTLAILEGQKEWSSDTPEDISDVALNLGLAGTNEDGEFVRK